MEWVPALELNSECIPLPSISLGVFRMTCIEVIV